MIYKRVEKIMDGIHCSMATDDMYSNITDQTTLCIRFMSSAVNVNDAKFIYKNLDIIIRKMKEAMQKCIATQLREENGK